MNSVPSLDSLSSGESGQAQRGGYTESSQAQEVGQTQRGGQAKGSGQMQHVSPAPSPSQLAPFANPQARIREWEATLPSGRASLETSAKLIEDFTDILADLNKRLKKL